MRALVPSGPVEIVKKMGGLLSRRTRWIKLLAAGVGIALVAGVGFELTERFWLAKEPGLHGLDQHGHEHGHWRGIIAFFAAGVVVIWFMKVLPLFSAKSAGERAWTEGRMPSEQKRAQVYAQWFMGMRWIAVLLSGIFVWAAVWVLRWLPEGVGRPLLATVGVLAASNLVYQLLLWQGRGMPRILYLQGYIDLVLLTTLLHFSGGIENPLSTMMVFHVIIGGILLSKRQCLGIAITGSFLFALMALGEWSGVLGHYTLEIFPHTHGGGSEPYHPAQHTLYAATWITLQTVVLLLTAFFVTTLAERLRENEASLETMAMRALAGQEMLEQALAQQKEIQAQVLHAGKLAAVGELAGQVAHEVNNPVSIISAKASLLLLDHGKEMSSKVADEVGKIGQLAVRVARIAQGLLSYCRPSAAIRTRIDLRVPLRKSLAIIEGKARLLGVAIDDQLPEQIPTVQANPDEMEQVFLNLFLNGLDAMPRGGWLTVSTLPEGTQLGDGRPAVAVVISDTGCGIPKEIEQRVFEPFFTTKSDGGGTGLGLSICLGLIRGHGGELEMASKRWQGTRVIVKLPVDNCSESEENVHG